MQIMDGIMTGTNSPSQNRLDFNGNERVLHTP